MTPSSTRTSGSRIDLYTDGGADPNPGPAGWGVVILDQAGRVAQELSGGEEHSTNNRMELTAAIRALEATDRATPVRVFTDSVYLKKGITEWLSGWIARGWKRRTGALQNEDLWRRLAALIEGREIAWSWVKGHAGDRHNERADELATREIRRHRGPDRQARREPADVEVVLRVSAGNGRGGWAAAVRHGEKEQVESGSIRAGSANELDILAAAEVLERLPSGLKVAVHTGSDYLRNGATQWLAGWRRSGWKTKTGTQVKNRSAWERLSKAMAGREVTWPSLKGDKPRGWKELGKLARDASQG